MKPLNILVIVNTPLYSWFSWKQHSWSAYEHTRDALCKHSKG